ncbi:unnamed protein product, partial [Musa banksii]
AHLFYYESNRRANHHEITKETKINYAIRGNKFKSERRGDRPDRWRRVEPCGRRHGRRAWSQAQTIFIASTSDCVLLRSCARWSTLKTSSIILIPSEPSHF